MRAIVLAAAALFLALPAAAQPETGQRILVVHSYHVGFHSVRPAVDEIEAAFAEDHVVKHVFLDTKRRNIDAAFADGFEKISRYVATEGKPDLVLTADDYALRFVRKHRPALFEGVPVVFYGVNSHDLLESASAEPNVTGVFEYLSVDKTLELAHAMSSQPLRRLIAIVNGTQSSQANLDQIKAALALYPRLQLQILSLDYYSFEEAAERLRREDDPGTASIFLAAFTDKTGRYHGYREIFGFLTPASARPIYALNTPSIENGATAGYAVSFRTQAQMAVGLGRRALAGEDLSDVEPLIRNVNVPMINEREALRYDLDIDIGWDGLRIINHEPSFIERNQSLVLSTICVFAAVIVMLLLAQVINFRVRRVQSILAERLKHESLHDPLTDLPNRRYIDAALRGELCDFDIRTLLHIDLDKFKAVNDTLGHEAGDHVLKTAAAILQRLAPADAVSARIGGDEFIILTGLDREDARIFGQMIVAEISKPIVYMNHLCRIGASVGLAEVGGEAENGLTLFQKADIALNKAKEEGRGQVMLFSPALGAQVTEERALVEDIARGLDAEEFEPFYQPQVDARTGEIVGVEALARWRHPEKGVLTPFAFLPTAERARLVSQIDRAILVKSVAHLAEWRAVGFEPPKLSVNVSAKRLEASCLSSGVGKLDLGQTRLCFEILESIFLDDESHPLIARIQELRDAGVRIEIDDFGTGHASIVALLKLMPDGLKIAREFVAPLGGDEAHTQLVRAMVDIGRSLGIETTAEGVETEEQIRILAELNCDVLQGYGICKPAPADEIEAFALERGARRAA